MAAKVDVPPPPQKIRIRRKTDRKSHVQRNATGARVPVSEGLEVVHEGRLKRVKGVTEGGTYLEDVVSGEVTKAKNGDYQLPEPGTSQARTLRDISVAEKKRAERIYKWLAPLARLDRNLTADELAGGCEKVDLKERATREYLRKLKVFDHWKSCIRNQPGPQIGACYLTSTELYIMDEVFEEWLNKEEAVTNQDIIERVSRQLAEIGQPDVSATTIRKYIRNRGFDLGLRRRISRKVEMETITPVGDGDTAIRPLQKVQIDSTRTDVIIVDEDGNPIGRPWITLIIDVYSRMILGMHISLDPPSAISVGAAIIDALTPKHEKLKNLGINEEWPCYGLFESITGLDHGAEHKNTAIMHGIKLLGLPEPKWRKNKTHGAIIERVIGRFVHGMHILPGTTWSNPKHRGDYDSRKAARLNIDDFERWMVLQVIKYHATPHRGLSKLAPLQVWEQGWAAQKKKVPDLIQNMRETRISFLPYKTPKACKEGFKVNGEVYKGPQIADMIRRRSRVRAHYDTRDLSRIWVKSPIDGKYVEVKWNHHNRPPCSLAYRQARDISYSRRGRSPRMRDIANRAGVAGDDVVLSASKRTRRRRGDPDPRETNRKKLAERELGPPNQVTPSPQPTPPGPERDSSKIRPWSGPAQSYRVWKR